MKKAASNYDLQVDIAKRIFLEYNQEVLIRKFRLEADEILRPPFTCRGIF